MKNAFITLICNFLRVYLIYFPVSFGKIVVYKKFIDPYFGWRTTEIDARTKFGAKFTGRLNNIIQQRILFFGIWEPGLTAYFRKILKPGDTVIDIGANVGVHTVLFSKLVGPNGRVHAIEASPTIFERLKKNLARNQADNVVAHSVAVLDKPQRVSVFLHESSNDGSTTVIESEASRRETTLETVIEAKPLDQIVDQNDLRRAKLIKIDVEGAEWLVIQGIKNILHYLPNDCSIIVEESPRALADFGASVTDLVKIFSDNGFEAYRIKNNYDLEFYISPGEMRPQKFNDDDSELADLLFYRDSSI